MSTRLGSDGADASAAGVCARMDGGVLRIWTGAPPAGGADDPISGQVMLCEVGLNTPAFGTPVGGVAAGLGPWTKVTILATGTPGWFQGVRADGVTVVWEGACGLAGTVPAPEMPLDSLDFVAGREFELTGLTYSQPRA
jgi:hypothetical protein